MNTWHRRYLSLCREVASWSKDPSTQVGACLTDARHRPLSFGFNGFPQAIPDNPAWLADRARKLDVILHAEENALIFARGDLSGATLYTWPLGPCPRCLSKLIQAGILQVVTVTPGPTLAARWGANLALSKELAQLAGVGWHEYELSLSEA